jgi:hypothetical protein
MLKLPAEEENSKSLFSNNIENIFMLNLKIKKLSIKHFDF